MCAEVDCGWVPYFKEQIDNNFQRLRGISDFAIRDLPSAYVDRHVYFTYITDRFGLSSLHELQVDRVMWSSDYPHISSDWPRSRETASAALTGTSAEDRERILAGNACLLYGLGE